jgi:hypothetical protein
LYTESVCGAQDEIFFLVVIEKKIVHRLDSNWNCDRKMGSALISQLQKLCLEALLHVVLSSNKGRYFVSLSASLQASVFNDCWTSGRSPHVSHELTVSLCEITICTSSFRLPWFA